MITGTSTRPDLASSGASTVNLADTYDWDTVFAINFQNANTALANNWSSVNSAVKTCNQASSEMPQFNLQNVVFSPWQIDLGGDGKNVNMRCPISSGSYNTPSASYSLAGLDAPTTVVIQVGMNWIPDPKQFFFVIDDNTQIDPIRTALDQLQVASALSTAFQNHGVTLAAGATVAVRNAGAAGSSTPGVQWEIVNPATGGNQYFMVYYSKDKTGNEFLNIYQVSSQFPVNLAVQAQGDDDQPPVVIVNVVNTPSGMGTIDAAVLPQLFSEWYNANLGNFNYVFALLNLALQIDTNNNWAWLTPTSTSYAVTDQGTFESSVFGVLTMANNSAPPASHQVSPNAIPAGSDAGFLIRGGAFVDNMLLVAASAVFNGAPLSSFLVTNDGLTVQNTSEMVWGNFSLSDKPKLTVDGDFRSQLNQGQIPSDLTTAFANAGIDLSNKATVSSGTPGNWSLTDGSSQWGLQETNNQLQVFSTTRITIPAGQFQLNLNGAVMEIQFINLNYPYTSDYMVHVNYTEQVTLGLQQQGGRNVFWFTQVLKNMTVNVTKTHAEITKEIIMDVISGVLALVAVAGPVLEGLADAAQVTEGLEEGSAIIDQDAFQGAESANPDQAEQSETDAANNAANDLKGDKWTSIQNAFKLPRWKIMGAITTVVGGLTAANQIYGTIVENAAQKQWENVPAFDDFANVCIKPYTWPGVTGYTLTSAALADSLQVGLTVTQ